MPRLRIHFPKPGFFLTDVRCEIHLNGNVVYDGGFLEGFDIAGDVAEGRHRIRTLIHLGPVARTKEVDVIVPGHAGLDVELRYSRFWGNFTSKPTLRVVHDPGPDYRSSPPRF